MDRGFWATFQQVREQASAKAGRTGEPQAVYVTGHKVYCRNAAVRVGGKSPVMVVRPGRGTK